MAEQKKSRGGADELAMLLSAPAVGVPHAADEQTRQTYIERQLAQRETYGQFRATGPIYVPGTGTLAFNKDQQVPMEHVEKWELEEAGLVKRVATPEHARAGKLTPKHARAAGYEVDDDDETPPPASQGGADAAPPAENPSGSTRAAAAKK